MHCIKTKELNDTYHLLPPCIIYMPPRNNITAKHLISSKVYTVVVHLSVRLFVYPLQAGIVQKRLNIVSRQQRRISEFRKCLRQENT